MTALLVRGLAHARHVGRAHVLNSAEHATLICSSGDFLRIRKHLNKMIVSMIGCSALVFRATGESVRGIAALRYIVARCVR